MFATSGKAQLAYDVSGPDVPVHDVLLLHAGVNDRRSWHHVVDLLAPRHRCIAYDSRGFGETTYEREDGWSKVDDAVAVLDAVGVDKAVVIASSMGGQTAIDLALAHPGRVEALVLIGSAIRGAPYPELTGRTAELDAAAEAAEEAGEVEEAVRLSAALWLDGPSAPEGRVSGEARELFLDMCAKPVLAEDPGDQAEYADAWPRLGEIDVPVMVLIGRLDAEDIQAVDEQAVALIPDARLVWLDGVAHLPHLEGDPTTLREISAFVGGLPAG